MSNYEQIVAFGSLLAGLGSVISAITAWKSVKASNEALTRAYEQDKRRLWSEIRALSAKAGSLARSVERVAADLTLAYKALFLFAGQAAGSARLKIYLERVDDELSKSRDRANNSKEVASSFALLSNLDFESASDSRARLEANVIELSLALDLLKDELSGIERQNDQYRAMAIGPASP